MSDSGGQKFLSAKPFREGIKNGIRKFSGVEAA